MSKQVSSVHLVASRRKDRGWSQEELSVRCGLPRSSVSAIEAGRLTPSVTAALAVARALECSVEEIFGAGAAASHTRMSWAWEPHAEDCRYWEAEVSGKRLLYPVEALLGSAWAHDGVLRSGVLNDRGPWDLRRLWCWQDVILRRACSRRNMPRRLAFDC